MLTEKEKLLIDLIRVQENKTEDKDINSTKVRSSNLKVTDFDICETIEGKEAFYRLFVVKADIKKIYFWTEIVGATRPTVIKHIWYYKNKKMAEVPLKVDKPRYRTWSCKTISPEWIGEWIIDVVDENGTPLTTQIFNIEK